MYSQSLLAFLGYCCILKGKEILNYTYALNIKTTQYSGSIKLYVCLLYIGVDGTSFITVPVNTAARLGESAQLNCSADLTGDDLEWREYISSPTGYRIFISGTGEVMDPNYDVVGDADGEYNLVVLSATHQLARSYQCGLIIEDLKSEAELVTLCRYTCTSTMLQIYIYGIFSSFVRVLDYICIRR